MKWVDYAALGENGVGEVRPFWIHVGVVHSEQAIKSATPSRKNPAAALAESSPSVLEPCGCGSFWFSARSKG